MTERTTAAVRSAPIAPMAEQRGPLFISFEGTEGSGKSTQMRLLVQRLRDEGRSVTENQEPGGTAIGKQIRHVLLDRKNVGMMPITELLLMFASRAQAAAEIVEPALARGEIVVSDRFTDSTLAYQGAARGLGFEIVQQLHHLAIGHLIPDLTICTVVDVEQGLQRARRRNRGQATVDKERAEEDRIDEQDLSFHLAVLEGYRAIAALQPERFRMVDAEGAPDEVAQRVWNEVRRFLQSSRREQAK